MKPAATVSSASSTSALGPPHPEDGRVATTGGMGGDVTGIGEGEAVVKKKKKEKMTRQEKWDKVRIRLRQHALF